MTLAMIFASRTRRPRHLLNGIQARSPAMSAARSGSAASTVMSCSRTPESRSSVTAWTAASSSSNAAPVTIPPATASRYEAVAIARILVGQRRRMLRLVEADVASTGEPQHRDRSPAGFLHVRAVDALLLERRHLRLHVGAPEVRLVLPVLIGRMQRDLGGRKREDEPAPAGVHAREPEHVA